jgi:hypothetical protein
VIARDRASVNNGLTNVLADPVIELHGPSGFTTITNNNWRDTQEAAITATGLAPTNDLNRPSWPR